MNDLLVLVAYDGLIEELPLELLGYRKSLVTKQYFTSIKTL